MFEVTYQEVNKRDEVVSQQNSRPSGPRGPRRPRA